MGNRTADQIMKLKEEGENILLQEAFNESLFKFFQFTIKATSRVFNDEHRLNLACIKVAPLTSFEKENRQLLRRLELYSNIPDLAATISN